MTVATRPENERRSSRRLEQDRLRAIVERIGDGIVIIGLDGAIRFANPAAEELFGRSLAQLTGADLGLPAVAGDATQIEIVKPQGASVTAELRVVETEWDREPVRLVSMRDVTDRKRAEEELRRYARDLDSKSWHRADLYSYQPLHSAVFQHRARTADGEIRRR